MDQDQTSPDEEQINSIIDSVFSRSRVQEISVDINSYNIPDTLDLTRLPGRLENDFKEWHTADYMRRFIAMGYIKDEFHDTPEQRGNWRRQTENELRQQHGDAVADRFTERLANNRLKINSINAIYGTLTIMRSDSREEFQSQNLGTLQQIISLIEQNYSSDWGEDRSYDEKVAVAEKLAQAMAKFLRSLAAE